MDADTVLRELVELKRLKDRLDGPSIRDLDSGEVPALRREYGRRKPAAWAAAFKWADKQAAPPAAQPDEHEFAFGGYGYQCQRCGAIWHETNGVPNNGPCGRAAQVEPAPVAKEWRNPTTGEQINPPVTLAPLKARPDFIAGYDAGLADGKRCAERDAPPAAQPEREPWIPYLSDRADGVRGHYAICRWHPDGYREAWNLRRCFWASASDEVLTLNQASALLKSMRPTLTAAQVEPATALSMSMFASRADYQAANIMALADAFAVASIHAACAALTGEHTTADPAAAKAALAAALAAQVEPAPAQPASWQPIETAPKDGSFVMLFDRETETPGRWIASWCEFEGDPDGGSWVTSALATICAPTHWMPLPDPPLAAAAQEQTPPAPSAQEARDD